MFTEENLNKDGKAIAGTKPLKQKHFRIGFVNKTSVL